MASFFLKQPDHLQPNTGEPITVQVVFDDDDAPPGLIWYGRSWPRENRVELNLPRLTEAALRLGVDLGALTVAVGLHEKLHLAHPKKSEAAVRDLTLERLGTMGLEQAAVAFTALMAEGPILGAPPAPAVGSARE